MTIILSLKVIEIVCLILSSFWHFFCNCNTIFTMAKSYFFSLYINCYLKWRRRVWWGTSVLYVSSCVRTRSIWLSSTDVGWRGGYVRSSNGTYRDVSRHMHLFFFAFHLLPINFLCESIHALSWLFLNPFFAWTSSRLGCQICVTKEFEGIKVTMPDDGYWGNKTIIMLRYLGN